jgi:hypothetical protein
MRRIVWLVGVVGIWALALGACASPASGPASAPSSGSLDPAALRDELRTAAASLKPTAGVIPAPTAAGIDPSLGAYVAIARSDLAARLGIAPDDIDVAAARVVTWPNAALGCPKPGMAYADQVIDGALIILRVGGRDYEYHSGGRTAPFLCEKVG